MKILDVKQTVFPEVKVIRFGRFADDRGFFSETFRKSDFLQHPEVPMLKDGELVQVNESYSKKGVIRGLHFQWDPYMGKLVRVVTGRMIDLFLDIRQGSPTYGKLATYELTGSLESEENEWIWIPVGFAHGGVFLEPGILEYFCTGEYGPGNEASISPFAPDIDWSLVSDEAKKKIDEIKDNNPLITEKDKDGFTVEQWGKSVNAQKFKY